MIIGGARWWRASVKGCGWRSTPLTTRGCMMLLDSRHKTCTKHARKRPSARSGIGPRFLHTRASRRQSPIEDSHQSRRPHARMCVSFVQGGYPGVGALVDFRDFAALRSRGDKLAQLLRKGGGSPPSPGTDGYRPSARRAIAAGRRSLRRSGQWTGSPFDVGRYDGKQR
jgi:hypothetical protein